MDQEQLEYKVDELCNSLCNNQTYYNQDHKLLQCHLVVNKFHLDLKQLKVIKLEEIEEE